MANVLDIEKLVKVSTYAKHIDKSHAWVGKLAERGDINMVRIDGVRFIITK